VWKANNFCLDGEGTANGVFALAARLSHACVGGENYRWVWDAVRGELEFWTERDIAVRSPPSLPVCVCASERDQDT